MPELGQITSLAVVGLARSGVAAARLARRHLPAVSVTGLDVRPREQFGEDLSCALDELAAAGVDLRLGPTERLPDRVDLVVKSPGVPNESAVVRAALARGVAVWGEVEFASRFLEGHDWIGITGTNGKTTTTELAGAILRDAGRPVEVAGNVGRAIAGLPDAIAPGATIVAELSSFQLEFIERFRPAVGVLLNLSEDHIDRHGTYSAYAAAKLRLFENQQADDLALLNADDPRSAGLEVAGSGRRATFSTADDAAPWASAVPGTDAAPSAGTALASGAVPGPGFCAPRASGVSGGRLWVESGGERRDLCAVGELALRGEHNLANSLAAAAATAAAGVPVREIAGTLRTFAGVSHRLQVVGVVSGVTYVNDSKATNVDAALKALTAYSGPVHLILGGSLKGAAYDELAAGTEGRVKQAVLLGQAAVPLREAFERRRAVVGARATPFVVVGDLEEAIRHLADVAVAGDVVLLSPACASFDQYRNFEHRGEHFTELVHGLGE